MEDGTFIVSDRQPVRQTKYVCVPFLSSGAHGFGFDGGLFASQPAAAAAAAAMASSMPAQPTARATAQRRRGATVGISAAAGGAAALGGPGAALLRARRGAAMFDHDAFDGLLGR